MPAVLLSLLDCGDCRPQARRSLLYSYPCWIAATAGRRPGGACCTLILTGLRRLPAGGQAEPAVLLSLLNLCDCRPKARRSLLYSYPYWIAATAGRRPGGACCTLILAGLLRLPAGGQAEPGRRPGGACCTPNLAGLRRLPAEGQAEPAVILALAAQPLCALVVFDGVVAVGGAAALIIVLISLCVCSRTL
jgi:hypothetical protein